MLSYCAWCGSFQGAKDGRGHRIRKNISEIDTATICPPCFSKMVSRLHSDNLPRRDVESL